MGEARRKHAGSRLHAGSGSSSSAASPPASAAVSAPGAEVAEPRSADEGRGRINLSLGPRLKTAVGVYAEALGMTESQLVLHALLLALPMIRDEAGVVVSGIAKRENNR